MGEAPEGTMDERAVDRSEAERVGFSAGRMSAAGPAGGRARTDEGGDLCVLLDLPVKGLDVLCEGLEVLGGLFQGGEVGGGGIRAGERVELEGSLRGVSVGCAVSGHTHLDCGGGGGISPREELAGDGGHGFWRDGYGGCIRDGQIHSPFPPPIPAVLSPWRVINTSPPPLNTLFSAGASVPTFTHLTTPPTAMAASLPIFHLLPGHHPAYPPSPTFSDPAFSAQYDSSFPANMDLSKSNHHREPRLPAAARPHPCPPPLIHAPALNSYPFSAPPGTSAPQYSSRHIPSYPNLVPPNFSRGSYAAVQGGEDPTAFLDLDLSQPGPSTYHQQQPQPQSAAHHYHQPDHEYVQSDAEDDESLVQVKEELQDERQEGEEQGADVDNEEPLYVNAKQYHRILKRRMARARLEELNRLVRSRKVCIRAA